jgi:hypothetical protein
MLASFFSSIPGLIWIALFFVLLWEFFRGMRALAQIATSLEHIEHTLTERPVAVPNPRVSHTAT